MCYYLSMIALSDARLKVVKTLNLIKQTHAQKQYWLGDNSHLQTDA